MMTDSEILAMKKVSTAQAARYLGMDDVTLRLGLQSGELPFGTAFKGTKDGYIYDIRPEALVDYKHHGKGIPYTKLATEISTQIINTLKNIGGTQI